jgi:hypothetical protein
MNETNKFCRRLLYIGMNMKVVLGNIFFYTLTAYAIEPYASLHIMEVQMINSYLILFNYWLLYLHHHKC